MAIAAVLTPAEAGYRVGLCHRSPVLRLGLPYAARVAGLGRRALKRLPARLNHLRGVLKAGVGDLGAG